jgi:hypothetical protein
VIARRGLTVAIALITALAVAAPSHAVVKRKKDRRAGVTFRLDGKKLSVRLSEQAPGKTVKALLGKRVAAVCGTRKREYGHTLRWPKERAVIGTTLQRDISRRATFCLIENARTGKDIAVVQFKR